ncbi:type 11 methyltransferase [Thermincola ferriacetica]|uniref:Type 11 methyltransferase n=1 Tax=Thermincola ferriacetica TaxID=281456 RepID=A0A0L6W6H3_9FIRM|nr:class I SAM-dependent methyltransferase [Thermincola ferriacetica]KNZ71120.1 type 11 methyltransferase [Thermincola ferriacetica]
MTKGKEYFDNIAVSWDEKFKPDVNKIEKILDIANIPDGSTVLDVGTGTGVLVPFLNVAGCRIDAVDISEKMLEVARAKFPGMANFIVADMQSADLQKKYDVVICHNVYPHFSDKELTLRNIFKHLLTGGRLLIAHSASRKEVNSRHQANREVKDDVLPPVTELAGLAERSGYKTIYTEDAEVYVYMGGKE